MAPAHTASFNEIRNLVHALPVSAGPASAGPAAGSAADWVARVQQIGAPRLDHPRIVIFAAAHGICADLPAGAPETIAENVARMVNGDAEAQAQAAALDCDFRLYELALDQPSRDSREAAALGEADAARAAAYGMWAVEPGVDLLSASALGASADIASAALGAALFPGSGLAPCGAAGDRAAAAIARHRGLTDPLDLLAALGGADIAAILGVILAARLAGIPVLLDGIAAHAAAAVAQRLRPDAIDHCRIVAAQTPDGTGFWERLQGRGVTIHPAAPPIGGLSVLADLQRSRG
jgi:nicotinate-nucleotide--dimethylbenzimidazole phosphoribosyltransferase